MDSNSYNRLSYPQGHKQSLSQIYEDEYNASQDGGAPGDDRDGKLQKEHQEIEQLWGKICEKLDGLCNAHFTPKQVSVPWTEVISTKFVP